MITLYELRDETGDLIRVLDSYEKAVSMLTSGDYIVKLKPESKPKVSLYQVAVKKVGYADL